MGWDIPTIYIERLMSSDPDQWGMVAKASTLIGFLEYPKAFLLGHGKYGPMPGWDPVTELRGLPADVSSEVSRLYETVVHNTYDPTWYSLAELEAIDLDAPMGLPDDADAIVQRPRRYLDVYTVVDNEPDEEIRPEQLEADTIRKLFDNHGWAEVDGDIIHSEPKTRRNYSHEFGELLEFMRDLCGDGKYNRRSEYTPDQVRIVLWASN